MAPEVWRSHFDAMVLSLMRLTELVLPGMRACGWGFVIPGRIATERIAFLDRKRAEREGKPLAQVQAESVGSIPVGRYGQVQEHGDAVAFLASARASFITGSVLRVDGGMVPSV